MKRFLSIAFIVISILIFNALTVNADEYLYKWTDENGTVHITDNETLIPKKYEHTVEKTVKTTRPKKYDKVEVRKWRSRGKRGRKRPQKATSSKTSSKRSHTPSVSSQKLYDQYESMYKGMIVKMEKFEQDLITIEEEYETRGVRSPRFYHQTYAKKRQTMKRLKEEINAIKTDITAMNVEIEGFKESARAVGVPSWVFDNIDEERAARAVVGETAEDMEEGTVVDDEEENTVVDEEEENVVVDDEEEEEEVD